MNTTFTSTETTTFTVTHAKYMASKVAADLKRIQRFYGSPSDEWINKYEQELTDVLKAGYLKSVTYGFQKDSKWIEPSVRYTAKDLASSDSQDDDPGKIRPGVDVSGAGFTSYLIRNSAWHDLTTAQRDSFEKSLPFQRNGAPEPGVNGYMETDRSYSSGGKAIDRSSVRKLS